MGIVNHAKGTWNAITHPLETAKTAMAAQRVGSPENVQATMGMVRSANALVNGNGFERGEVIGGVAAGIVEGVALTKGAGMIGRTATIGTRSVAATKAVSQETMTLYHGGVLRNGVVDGAGSLSTTPEMAHAAQYAGLREGGQITTFSVPKDLMKGWIQDFSVQELRDNLSGTSGSALEYRFHPSVAPQMNKYTIPSE